MSQRLNPAQAAPAAYRAMRTLQAHVNQNGLDKLLEELIKIRASQINGCAFCLAMHVEAARGHGERQLRIDLLAAWAEAGDLYPFDRATAIGNGFAQQCLNWPPVDVSKPDGPRDLPDVPVLLLAGTLDLSTPLEWAQRAAARAPGGKLVVVENAGHGVQNQKDPKMLETLRAFIAALAG